MRQFILGFLVALFALFAGNAEAQNLSSTQWILNATGTLGASTGRAIFTNGTTNAYVLSVFFAYTATATVGTRNIQLVVKNASGGVMWAADNGFAQTAGLTENYAAGASQPNLATGGIITLNLPNPLFLPAGGTITVLDSANIDVNDSVVNPMIVLQHG